MAVNSFLLIIAAILVLVIITLTFVYLSISAKEKQEKKKKEEEEGYETSKIAKNYSVSSIFDFMEFDKVEDNMIIQKNGKKFLMAIECQGINYDLMSDMEKTGVESGFIQFLNTLTNPIQIYVQTRTINLDKSIQGYKARLARIEDELVRKGNQYRKALASENQNQKQINNLNYEVTRLQNLYEYGKDIISTTEKMSSNKNVLKKKYYIIISYYYSSVDGENLEEYEIRDFAFSDLYAKAQAIIRTLSSTEVTGRILNSYELVDLLYNAYNRDESEQYGIERALEAGYDDLYSSAPDYLERRMKAIDKEIGEKALEMAKGAVLFAQKEQKELQEKEQNMDELITELAKQLIEENSEYMPDEITIGATKRVEQIAKKRGRPKKNKEES